MIFGDPADFAIEAEPDTMPTSSIVWGHMRVWCCGKAFGNFHESDCGLSGAQVRLSELANALGALTSPLLAGLDDQSAWDFLDGALYLDEDRSDEEVQLDADAWSRHNFLTNSSEAFDGFKSFIYMRDRETLRILVRRSDEILGAHTVTAAGFVTAANQFEQWCNAIVSKRHAASPAV
jgi:hypothetical protein